MTLPELERDIDAQLRLLADPDHPKRAVFLARSNSLGDRKLPAGLFVERRREGTLITHDATLAALFQTLEFITDREIACMLGYPECKADILQQDGGLVVQALDADGCIIFEAAATEMRLSDTVAAAESQKPYGGQVRIISPLDAIAHRIPEMN